MSAPSFEWDPKKAATNLHDHGVAFDEAVAVFDDDFAIDEVDDDPDETRFRIVYTERGKNRIRIISARRATKHEIKTYRQG